jgi:predicted CXXCH cytochrome family protein
LERSRVKKRVRGMVKRINFFIVCITSLCITTGKVIPEDAEIHEYIGSQACLGCHVEIYSAWKSSNHARMVIPIINSTDLPLNIEQASTEIQEELRNAAFMVANSFFIARDPSSQHYKLLNVIYDKTANAYRPSNFSLDWSTQCAGCHTTNMNTLDLTWGEAGIGCEACHGPGLDHATNMGDKTKIVAGKDADICGQCHGGNDVQTGGNLMADGTKWVVGYRPGMQLSSVPGIQLTPVDPSKTPPDSNINVNHLRNYNMWKASGHGNSLSLIVNNERVTADCYGCHSAEGFLAKQKDESLDISQKESFNSISCVACHNPHNNSNPGQLVMSSEKLCDSCHTQGRILQGTGASDVEDTRSFHSELECVQCHMTEANHLMKVIRPDAPDLAESRQDSCTFCHKDSNKKAQAGFLQGMQSKFTNRMDTLQSDLQTIAAAIKTNPSLLDSELKPKFNSARMNLSLLQRDGSQGVHNFEYATKVMDKAQKDIESIKAAMN